MGWFTRGAQQRMASVGPFEPGYLDVYIYNIYVSANTQGNVYARIA